MLKHFLTALTDWKISLNIVVLMGEINVVTEANGWPLSCLVITFREESHHDNRILNTIC